MAVFLFAAAVFCWVMAVRAAMRLAKLMPGEYWFATFQRLGRWDFETIRQRAGSGADAEILTYKRSFAGFFVLVLIVIAFAALSIAFNSASNSGASSEPVSSSASP